MQIKPCEYCGNPTELVCKECEQPTCEDCSASEEIDEILCEDCAYFIDDDNIDDDDY